MIKTKLKISISTRLSSVDLANTQPAINAPLSIRTPKAARTAQIRSSAIQNNAVFHHLRLHLSHKINHVSRVKIVSFNVKVIRKCRLDQVTNSAHRRVFSSKLANQIVSHSFSSVTLASHAFNDVTLVNHLALVQCLQTMDASRAVLAHRLTLAVQCARLTEDAAMFNHHDVKAASQSSRINVHACQWQVTQSTKNRLNVSTLKPLRHVACLQFIRLVNSRYRVEILQRILWWNFLLLPPFVPDAQDPSTHTHRRFSVKVQCRRWRHKSTTLYQSFNSRDCSALLGTTSSRLVDASKNQQLNDCRSCDLTLATSRRLCRANRSSATSRQNVSSPWLCNSAVRLTFFLFSVPMEFETTQKLSYMPVCPAPKDDMPWARKAKYCPPSIKFAKDTVAKLSFQPPGCFLPDYNDYCCDDKCNLPRASCWINFSLFSLFCIFLITKWYEIKLN